MRIGAVIIFAGLALAGCGRLSEVGRAPDLTPPDNGPELQAMVRPGPPQLLEPEAPSDQASLWTGARGSLFGNRRAETRGDILTVVIEIDDRAEIQNTSERSRSSSQSLGIPSLFGIPQRINEQLPDGASLGDAVSTDASSRSVGDGSVVRNERLELRVAATVLDVLANGTLQIQGTQEVRVNYELRELIVTGFVRPEDISRRNEITYDKIAAARISYGGRGQISDVQQPRYGQQVADILLPF